MEDLLGAHLDAVNPRPLAVVRLGDGHAIRADVHARRPVADVRRRGAVQEVLDVLVEQTQRIGARVAVVALDRQVVVDRLHWLQVRVALLDGDQQPLVLRIDLAVAVGVAVVAVLARRGHAGDVGTGEAGPDGGPHLGPVIQIVVEVDRRQDVDEVALVRGVVRALHLVEDIGVDLVVGALDTHAAEDLRLTETGRRHQVPSEYVLLEGEAVLAAQFGVAGIGGEAVKEVAVALHGALQLGQHGFVVDDGAQAIEARVFAVEQAGDRLAVEAREVGQGAFGVQIQELAIIGRSLGTVEFPARLDRFQPGGHRTPFDVDLALPQLFLSPADLARQAGEVVLGVVVDRRHAGVVQHPFGKAAVAEVGDVDALVAQPAVLVAAELHLVAVVDIVLGLGVGQVVVDGEVTHTTDAAQVQRHQRSRLARAFPEATQAEALRVPGPRGAVERVVGTGRAVGVGDAAVAVAVHDLGCGVAVDPPQLGVRADDGVIRPGQTGHSLVDLGQAGRVLAGVVAEVQAVAELVLGVFVELTAQVKVMGVAAIVEAGVQAAPLDLGLAEGQVHAAHDEGLGVPAQGLAVGIPDRRLVIAVHAVLFELRLAARPAAGDEQAPVVVELASERAGDLARLLIIELVQHPGRGRQDTIGGVMVKGRRRADVDRPAQGVAVPIRRQALDDGDRVDAFRRQKAEADATIEVVIARAGPAHADAVHGVVVQLGRQAADGDAIALARRMVTNGIDARQARQRFSHVIGRQVAHVVGADDVGDEVGLALGVQRPAQARRIADHLNVLDLEGVRRSDAGLRRLAHQGQNTAHLARLDARSGDHPTQRLARRHRPRDGVGGPPPRKRGIKDDLQPRVARQGLQRPAQVLGRNGDGDARLGAAGRLPGVGRRGDGRQNSDGGRREEAGLVDTHSIDPLRSNMIVTGLDGDRRRPDTCHENLA